jgi:DNA polymerase-1
MEKLPPIYIIDGSGYIFRAYYAIRSLSTSKGLPTNAVYGFTQMLLKLIKDKNPEYLAMVFDSKEPSFRKKEYPEYKANRELPPEDLIPQFDYIKKVTRALNVPLLQVPGFEADDIIATLAKKICVDRPVVIVTGDKDLMQLVDDRVTLFDPMKDKQTGIEGVLEKFGVDPARVIEVQALSGDPSDNVPGVPGIGPKTAIQLIQEFGSLDGVYQNLDKIKGKKQENLREHKKLAYLSRKLVTLSEQVPVELSLEDLKCRSAKNEECRTLFEELEFHRLLEAMGPAPEKLDRGAYELVQSPQAFESFLGKLKKAKVFSFDTETTSLEISQAALVGLSFALKSGEAYYLPMGHNTGEPQLELSPTLDGLKPLFENSKIPKLAQHFKFDAGILQRYGIDVQGLQCDTLLGSYLLDPASSHRLDFLSLKFLGHKMISYEEVTKELDGDFSRVPLERAKAYSAEDADVTFQLGEIFLDKLGKENLLPILQELEQPLSRVLLKMELTGVRVDKEFLKKLQGDFTQRMAQIEKNIYRLAGEDFNIQSTKQLGVILFEKLKLEVLKKTKTGYSTDVGVLTLLSSQHDLPREILAYRSLAKLKSTYVDALLTQIDPKTGRVHTHFNQTVAETGRLSSNDPNLQNIPIRSEDGAKIRRAFIADEGYVLLSADYSQIELRVLAHFSEDPALLKAFAKNEDVHRLTASGVFGMAPEKVTPAMRGKGKTLNFAVVYGQTPFGLSGQLGVSQREAREYIENYFAKYRGVKKFRDQVLAEARMTGEVRTLLGRRRFVPDLNSKNFGARSLAERIAFNTVIQGTAADIIKKAMIGIDKEMVEKKLNSRMLIQVHDELVFEVKKSELDEVKKLVKKHMEGVVEFKVPLTVEMGVGPNWAEAH